MAKQLGKIPRVMWLHTAHLDRRISCRGSGLFILLYFIYYQAHEAICETCCSNKSDPLQEILLSKRSVCYHITCGIFPKGSKNNFPFPIDYLYIFSALRSHAVRWRGCDSGSLYACGRSACWHRLIAAAEVTDALSREHTRRINDCWLPLMLMRL